MVRLPIGRAPQLTIDEERLIAGRSYLTALQKLGLNPDALFWVQEATDVRYTLMLVTEQYDEVGPLALSETLFDAYRVAATPREISPFIVRLHSPWQTFIRDLNVTVLGALQAAGRRSKTLNELDQKLVFDISAIKMSFLPSWIYKFEIPHQKGSPAELDLSWRRIRDRLTSASA